MVNKSLENTLDGRVNGRRGVWWNACRENGPVQKRIRVEHTGLVLMYLVLGVAGSAYLPSLRRHARLL